MWILEFYQSENGRSPVKEFVDELDAQSRAKVAKTLNLLEEYGIALGMPYTKHLEKHLWELRIRQARNQYRVIYFLSTGQNFVMLHGFAKKTSAVSRADVETAKRRQDDYLARRGKGI